MGEITQDILVGACCSLCNCYFVNFESTQEELKNILDPSTADEYEHGYPVLCKDCAEEDSNLPVSNKLIL